MISSYSDYILKYIRGKDGRAIPGEHHFVAAYLIHKLFEINKAVPDYINPDGGKAVLGDIIYCRDGQHHFSIEAKLQVVRLTVREYNDWIVTGVASACPNIFIGVGKNGIVLSSWDEFRSAYLRGVRNKKEGHWLPEEIINGYGPLLSMNLLKEEIGEDCWFPAETVEDSARIQEERFLSALRRHLQPTLKLTVAVD